MALILLRIARKLRVVHVITFSFIPVRSLRLVPATSPIQLLLGAGFGFQQILRKAIKSKLISRVSSAWITKQSGAMFE